LNSNSLCNSNLTENIDSIIGFNDFFKLKTETSDEEWIRFQSFAQNPGNSKLSMIDILMDNLKYFPRIKSLIKNIMCV
jgi:hypothetical protein